jgi:hypothetical protein
LWFTVLKDVTYTDWFHLAKVYSSTAGCIGFWCIRHVKLTNKKTGKEWKLADEAMFVLGGPWNYMNGIAGILNIITITGCWEFAYEK